MSGRVEEVAVINTLGDRESVYIKGGVLLRLASVFVCEWDGGSNSGEISYAGWVDRGCVYVAEVIDTLSLPSHSPRSMDAPKHSV